MEEVFRALADPTRRELLDRLFTDDGQTLGGLAAETGISRQAVAKHLAQLEAAGLVVTRRAGRSKHHYINTVPIQQISERWMDKFGARVAASLTELKRRAEQPMTKPSRAWEIYIKATPERIWDAFVNPDMISRWSHDTRPTSEIRAGATVTYVLPDGTEASRIEVLDFQPGRRIQMRAQMLFHPDMREDPPYMLTWELEAVSPRVTRVTVTAEFEAENATFRLISGGQQPILDDLKTLLETGETMWAA